MTNKAKKSIVAEQLKKIIDDRGLKQKKVAEILGYDYRTFNNMLNGYKMITTDDVIIIATKLGVEPNQLYGWIPMSKSTDHEFNEIVYDSVLPEIARAFCSLKKEVSGNKLVNELSPEENEIIKIKSKMLNKVITDFIQKQL